MKLDKIMEKFKAYCNPRKNLTYERHIFNTKKQQEQKRYYDRNTKPLKPLNTSIQEISKLGKT